MAPPYVSSFKSMYPDSQLYTPPLLQFTAFMQDFSLRKLQYAAVFYTRGEDLCRASQGLGQQILIAFCCSGGHGAVVDLSLDSAKKSIEDINKEVKAAGLPAADLRAYECNAADEDAVKKTFDQIVRDFGRVDVLCANAGITGGGPAEEYPFDEWKQMMEVNVDGTFLFARAAGKHMIERGIKGTILFVSSMSGRIVNKPQKQVAYNTSKAATVMTMKSMAAEWGEHGIRVNSLSPGYIQTVVNAGEEMEALSKKWVDMIPLSRIAKPEEFRGTAVYLASDASSYLTGAEIIVDGGYTVW